MVNYEKLFVNVRILLCVVFMLVLTACGTPEKETGSSAATTALSDNSPNGSNTEPNSPAASSDTPASSAVPGSKPELHVVKVRTGMPRPVTEGISIKKYSPQYTSFKFITASGQIIISDPCAMDETIIPDIVTESHNDFDHCDESMITGDFKRITDPWDYDFGNIKITGVIGSHNKDDSGGNGPNNIYVFDMEGLRIAQFASQGIEPTEEMYEKIGKIDILIVQFFAGENTKMNIQDCVSIAKHLEPRIIIPAHGQDDREGDLAWFLEYDLGMADSNEIILSKGMLDAMERPMVLDLDNRDKNKLSDPYSDKAKETIDFAR